MTAAVAAGNAEQARAWDGGEVELWAAHHQTFESTLARYHPGLIDAADVRVDHQVLDVGCGTGGIARQVARLAAAGHVRGVDLSRRMLDVGRALAAAEGLRNITFEQADAQVHPFPRRFHDRVLSCTGAMFFGDPGEAFANLRGSLVEGGQLVMLTWQPAARQEWFSAFTSALTGRNIDPGPDVPGPFSLSEPDRIQQVLRRAGFTDVECTGVTESTTYGRTADDAHTLLLALMGWTLDGFSARQRVGAEQKLWDTLASHDAGDGIWYDSAAWLVTARVGRSSHPPRTEEG